MEYGGVVSGAGAPERTLDDDELSRLDDVRRRAAEAIRQTLKDYTGAGPADPLGGLAWLAGGLGSGLDNPEAAEVICAAVTRARDDRYSWRQIAGALGEGGSVEDGRRVSDRHRRWLRNGS